MSCRRPSMSWMWPRSSSGRQPNEVLTLEGRQEHHEILLENLSACLRTAWQQERETLTRRLQEQETQMQAVRQEIAAHEGEAERLSRQAEESRAGQSDLQTRTDEISGQITEHKTALAALAAERGTSLHSRQELERLQVQMHSRPGRTARRCWSGSAGPMRIADREHGYPSRRRRKSCGAGCRQLKEQLACAGGGEAGAGAPRARQQNQEMPALQ